MEITLTSPPPPTGTGSSSRRSSARAAAAASSAQVQPGLPFPIILTENPNAPAQLQQQPGAVKRGSRTAAPRSVRINEEGGVDEDDSLEAGMRRIQSSPSLNQGANGFAAASASATSLLPTAGGFTRGKKTASSSDLTSKASIASSKAARRLARKAEAARVSRRKKKAYLEQIEQHLTMLEDRYANLLAQGAGGGASSGSNGGTINRDTQKKKKRRSLPPSIVPGAQPVPINPLSPNPHSLSSSKLASLPEAVVKSESPVVPAPPPKNPLPDRFNAVLNACAMTREHHTAQRFDFLEQVARMTSPTLDFIMWLLTDGLYWNEEQGRSVWHVPSSTPPCPPASYSVSPQVTLWHDVLRHEAGLTESAVASLLTPQLMQQARTLRESAQAQLATLAALRQTMSQHLQLRTAQHYFVWDGFKRKQKEILSATAFQQQARHAAAQAQAALAAQKEKERLAALEKQRQLQAQQQAQLQQQQLQQQFLHSDQYQQQQQQQTQPSPTTQHYYSYPMM